MLGIVGNGFFESASSAITGVAVTPNMRMAEPRRRQEEICILATPLQFTIEKMSSRPVDGTIIETSDHSSLRPRKAGM
ncbi:hypothetical protein W02_17530 [Nitrospira sp. KM1]|nr:hypothetical protein W02_17530 [Nitrospira sp. KM1]